VHAPAWHVSTVVHALPSLQAVPFTTFENAATDTAGWHA
jgi:hypothetical protein